LEKRKEEVQRPAHRSPATAKTKSPHLQHVKVRKRGFAKRLIGEENDPNQQKKVDLLTKQLSAIKGEKKPNLSLYIEKHAKEMDKTQKEGCGN